MYSRDYFTQNNYINQEGKEMMGVPGSEHWAKKSIYKILEDKNYHTMKELCLFVESETQRYIKPSLMSVVIHRLNKKHENIETYRGGLFRLIS